MKNILRASKYIILGMVLMAVGFFSTSFYKIYKNYFGSKEESAVISNEQSRYGQVLGEEEGQTNQYSSENFRVPQITFGGDAITFPSGQDSNAPEIEDLRSQLLMTKSDQKVKFLLSWKTNKPCRSSIEYMTSGQASGKIIEEDGYGFVHSAEISPLNYTTSYSYIVKTRDKWGNETDSEKLAFYTGAPNVSILDLIAGAFRDMFGWASR
jgi:hypothetical protein